MPAAAESGTEGSRFPLLEPLRVRNFRLYWFGENFSIFGDQFYLVALPWLVLQLTGSNLALGSVLMAAGIPRAVFMLGGGALCDRFSPRSLMVVSNAVRFALVATLAGLLVTGHLRVAHLYFFALAFGFFDALYYPALTSLMPALVGGEHLMAANGLLQGTAQAMSLLGPGAAGVIIAAAGLAAAFAWDAITFLVSIAMLLLLRLATVPRSAASAGPAAMLRSIKEGLNYAWSDPAIRTLIGVIASVNLCVTGALAVAPAALARQVFQGGPKALGLMLSSVGAGALLGTFSAGSIRRLPHRGRVLFLAIATGSLGLGAMAAWPRLAVACASLAWMGIGAGFVNVLILAWIQTRAQPEMLGRVMSVLLLSGVGLQPVSFIVAGALADISVRLLLAAAGGAMLSIALLSRARLQAHS